MPTDSPYPRPLTAPAPWLELVGPAEEGEPAGLGEHGLPGEGWPSLETVDYLSKLITLIVLLLALPWLFEKLLGDPRHASLHGAEFAMGPGSAGV